MRRLLAAAMPPALRGRLRGAFRRLHPDEAIAVRAFDADFYLRTNPDVAAAGHDPLDHFMRHGWREGRDPAADFSVSAYLRAFPDVAASGVNPFVHYLTSGRRFDAPPESALGFRYEIIERLVPVAERLPKSPGPAPDPEADLAKALRRSRGKLAGLHVTFSHDDYSVHLGGLQLAIRREAQRLAELGRDHLHLYPARPWPVVRESGEAEPLGVVWNGERIGVFEPAAVARAVGKAAGPDGQGRSFAIHSLLGHSVDETIAILAAAGLSRGVFWLHDFASLCAGFHLLRNDVEDCAAPPPHSAACGVCLYSPWRERHLAGHARLFERLSLTVAAPSQSALDLWTGSAPFAPAATAVLPHATLVPRGPAPVADGERPFRLAYAGLPVAHKGWPIFRALALRFAEDPRYEFLHLGARGEPGLPVRFEAVNGGMAEALAAAEPDAVLVWPLCRETFSFVAHEAVAAGCAVVTGPDSGNVQAFVTEGGHGLVLDEAALAAAFESGDILQLARARRRPMLYDLRFGALTLDLPA